MPTQVVEQLQWWRIRPGSMVLETQIKLISRADLIDQIPLSVDPRLRLISSLQSGPIAGVEPDPADERKFTVHLVEPAEEVTVRLSWRWEGASGMGRFVLPRVVVREGEVVRDWSAVSLDPSLKLASQFSDQAIIPPAEFAAAWPPPAGPPSIALRHDSSEPQSVIAIEPFVQLPTAEQTADWAVSTGIARARYTFQLTGAAANGFEHTFGFPAGLRVTEASLVQSGQPAQIRWWQQPDGRLRISILDSPQATQEIHLRGEAKIDAKANRFTLPHVHMETATVAAKTLRLYRQPDVQLSIDAAPAWQPISELPIGHLQPGWGRLVAALQHTPNLPQTDLVVQVRPNDPNVTGSTVISAAPANGDWHCQLRLDSTTTGGVLDQLRFLVPEDWQNDFRIEPEMPFRFDRAATEDQLLLTVEPREALTGRTVLTLTSSLSFSGGGVRVPDVQVLGIEKLTRQVFLASASASQEFDWVTNGLAPISVTPGELPVSEIADRGTLYRVTASQFRAVANYRQDLAAKAQILLLENNTLILASGKALTTSSFLVTSAFRAPLRFELPPHCRILQTSVDGLAMNCEQTGVRTWQLPPSSAVLPMELQIIYEHGRTHESNAPGSLMLAHPEIIGLKPPAALWSIRGPAGLPAIDAEAVLAVQPSNESLVEYSQRQAELLRLEAYAKALDVVQAARAGMAPNAVLAESYFRWEGRAATADRRMEEQQNRLHNDDESQLRRKLALESVSAVRQRLFQAGILSEELHTSIPVTQQSPVDRQSLLFLVSADTAILRLPAADSPLKTDAGSWSLAALMFLGAVLLKRAADSLALRDWLLANRGMVLALVGVLWWMLTPLGWLGWIPLAVGVWLGLKQLRRSKIQPADSLSRGA